MGLSEGSDERVVLMEGSPSLQVTASGIGEASALPFVTEGAAVVPAGRTTEKGEAITEVGATEPAFSAALSRPSTALSTW